MVEISVLLNGSKNKKNKEKERWGGERKGSLGGLDTSTRKNLDRHIRGEPNSLSLVRGDDGERGKKKKKLLIIIISGILISSVLRD